MSGTILRQASVQDNSSSGIPGGSMGSVVDLAQDSPLGLGATAQRQHHKQAEVIDLSSNDSEEDVCGEGEDKAAQQASGLGSRKRSLWGEVSHGSGLPGASRQAGGVLGAEGSSRTRGQQEIQGTQPLAPPAARRHLRVKLPSHMRSPAGQAAPSLSGPSLAHLNLMAPSQQTGPPADAATNGGIHECPIQGSIPCPSSSDVLPSQSNHPSHQGLPAAPMYGHCAGHPSMRLPSGREAYQEQGVCTNNQQQAQGQVPAGQLLHREQHHQQHHQQQQQEQQQPQHGMLQDALPPPWVPQPVHLQHQQLGCQQGRPHHLSLGLGLQQPLEQQQQQQQLLHPLEQPQQHQPHPQQHLQQSHGVCNPARQRRRLNPPSLPRNPPVQPHAQGSHHRSGGSRPQQLLGSRREGNSNTAAEVYTLEVSSSSSSDGEVEVTACAGPPPPRPQAQQRRRTVQTSGRQRAHAAAAVNTPSSHTSSFSGLDDDEKLALELQREEDSRLARELAQRLEEEEREERIRARWDAMEAIEEAESRRPLFAPPRGPAAPFRPPSFTSHSAIPPPPSRSNRSRGLSFESHVFGPGPSPSRSRPHSYGAFRGRSHRTGEGSSNRSLPPLPHALFGMMDSDTDDSRDGYEYERGRHGRGPMLGRGRGGFGFGMGLFGGPFGGGMGGRGFGMQGLLAAGGRGSNLPPNLLFSDRDFTADDYEALCRLDESVENRTGATRAEINALPTEVVRKTKPQAGSAEQEGGERVEVLECAICIEEVQPGEVLRTTPCLHKFHKKCLDTWLAQKARCPVCQASCRV